MFIGDPVGRRGAPVLCYHAVQDVTEPGALAPFILPITEFDRQLDAVLADGWTFVSGAAFASAHLEGRRLPPRSVLLTLDDGFDDLESVVAPMLIARRIPAIAFVVTQLLGRTNEWDAHRGGPPLRLLDVEGLHRISRLGIEIAPHTRSHPRLVALGDAQLQTEIAGAKSDLDALGFPASPFFAYPYGSYDRAVTAAVKNAGIPLAFAVRRRGAVSLHHRLKLPRIVIERGHDPVAALNAAGTARG